MNHMLSMLLVEKDGKVSLDKEWLPEIEWDKARKAKDRIIEDLDDWSIDISEEDDERSNLQVFIRDNALAVAMKGKNQKTKELVESFLDKIEDVQFSELIEDLGKPLTAPPKINKAKEEQKQKGASKQVKSNLKEEKKAPIAKKKSEEDDDEEDGSDEKIELREIFTKKY